MTVTQYCKLAHLTYAMKQRQLLAYFGILITFLQGCTALHIPQSEILLVEKPGEEEDLAAGFSVTSGLWNKDIQPYALEEHFQEGLVEKVARRHFYGISLSGLFAEYKSNALGFSVGSGGIGVDFTQRFLKKAYFTAIGNGNLSAEGILQTPVYRTRKSGLSLGAFYRSERHGIVSQCERIFCISTKIGVRYRVSAFGLRINQYLEDDKARLGLRFSIGYSPELKGIVISGGLHTAANRRMFNKGAY